MEILHTKGDNEGSFTMMGGERLLGELTYSLNNGTMVLEHTGVEESFRDQGIGHKLVLAAVNTATQDGKELEVKCEFANAVLNKTNPETIKEPIMETKKSGEKPAIRKDAVAGEATVYEEKMDPAEAEGTTFPSKDHSQNAQQEYPVNKEDESPEKTETPQEKSGGSPQERKADREPTTDEEAKSEGPDQGAIEDSKSEVGGMEGGQASDTAKKKGTAETPEAPELSDSENFTKMSATKPDEDEIYQSGKEGNENQAKE